MCVGVCECVCVRGHVSVYVCGACGYAHPLFTY